MIDPARRGVPGDDADHPQLDDADVDSLRARVAWLERCVFLLGSRTGERLPPKPGGKS